jgi:iron complex outermembrane receptor protein
MTPGEVLILVNGKRVHSPAVIGVGPILNGALTNDIGWIPSTSIERIEILRDGAAAQYGSDAVAGVMNIVLKSVEGSELDVSASQTFTSEGGRTFHDGEVLDLGGSYGAKLGAAGSLTFTGQLRDRKPTNRAYPDARPQYFTGDRRNNNPPEVRNQEGDAEGRDAGLMLNAALPLTRIELYGFAGAMDRTVKAAQTFRRAFEARNTVRAIFPDGYTPFIEKDVRDYTTSAGARGKVRSWRWDLSSTIGSNSVRYDVTNTLNASLGTSSPTTFYIGTLRAQQWTSNLNLARQFKLAGDKSVNVAAGSDIRWERFEISGGDSLSYVNGGQPVLDGDSAGVLATVGAQGMLGYRPEDEVSATRFNIAGYMDVETRVAKRLLLDVAARAEHYSDTPSTLDGKIAARLEVKRGIAVRAGAGTGFRAPSLIQSHYATTRSTFFPLGGTIIQSVIRLLPVNSPAARILGARPLVPERSTNLRAGIVIDKSRWPTITADYYDIFVRDRIIRSNDFRDPSVTLLLESQGVFGVAGGQYFANAVNTRTRGIDIVASYGVVVGSSSVIKLIAGFNRTQTRVTDVAALPPELEKFQSVLFSRLQEGQIEAGQPDRTLSLTADYSIRRFNASLRNIRMGQASLLDSQNPAGDNAVAAKWITDLSVSCGISQRIKISAAVANLFDIYPTEWSDFKNGVNATGGSVAGNFRYLGGISPFGMNGRTLYARLSYR